MLSRAKDLPASGAHHDDWRVYLRTVTLVRLRELIKAGGGLAPKADRVTDEVASLFGGAVKSGCPIR
jgi:hypothetical protein